VEGEASLAEMPRCPAVDGTDESQVSQIGGDGMEMNDGEGSTG
jgi:hypothetical protein